MKNIKKFTPVLIIILTFFISGCYTQLAVKDRIPDDREIVDNDEPYNDNINYDDIDDTLNTDNDDYYYNDDYADPQYNISLSFGYNNPWYS